MRWNSKGDQLQIPSNSNSIFNLHKFTDFYTFSTFLHHFFFHLRGLINANAKYIASKYHFIIKIWNARELRQIFSKFRSRCSRKPPFSFHCFFGLVSSQNGVWLCHVFKNCNYTLVVKNIELSTVISITCSEKTVYRIWIQARGPKKHMKRLAAPSHWMLSKIGGVYV